VTVNGNKLIESS